MPPQMANEAARASDRRSRPRRAVAGGRAGRACSWRWPAGLGGEQGRSIRTVRAVALAQGLLTLFAFGALIALFLRSDMSVLLVAENSHSQKPWLYKFAGAWGNHEGSMLLWVTVLALAGAVVALFERRLDERTLGASLGAQAALALGFFAFLLFASNPFERLDPAPLDGRGLNPLLQDPGPRLPSADALPRLCRPVGRLQPGGRRPDPRQCRPGDRPGDAALGAGRLDPADARHHRRQLLGLL